ncbi:MAG: hypothetical protein ACYTEQ_06520 [Planctomycetota bacterium]|jgi:hypothetical protein
MKNRWDALMFVVFIVGGAVTALLLTLSVQAALMPGALTVLALLACQFMIWRNDVYERNAERHEEITRLLKFIYKAASRDH